MPTKQQKSKKSKGDAALTPSTSARVSLTTTKPLPLRQPAEFNLARLNLFSIQERIPAHFTSWSTEVQLGEETGFISCLAPQESGGVPHGIDADIANAIIDLFIESGSPRDGVLHVTPYQILSKANLDKGGKGYAALRESLDRLTHSVYTIGNSWRDHGAKRWTNAKFSLILESTATTADRTGLDGSSTYTITIAQFIVRSIRSNYTKPVNTLLLNSLKRTFTRSLYRLLDARRHNPVTLDIDLDTLSMSLAEWAQECKLSETGNAAQIKKLLKNAHADLVDLGYLKNVTYSGRGAKTIVTYEFNPSELTEDPTTNALIKDLHESFKLSTPNARKLISQFGAKHVRERAEVARGVLQATTWRPKSLPGFVTDVVKSEDGKYAAGQVPAAVPATQALVRTGAPIDEHTEFEKTLDAMTREELIQSTLRLLQVTLHDYLSGPQFTLLLTAMERGVLNPQDLRTENTRAIVNNDREAFARRVLERLTDPPSTLF
ncbi:replication initiator protein A [Deinococcus ficus]|uniref:replication initiator protein A n=1 Tax=Deinococcus ficus TaxID=317577 RepID=UPI0003B6E04D|nr:replication initiator protein A [Deinococcus ficus]